MGVYGRGIGRGESEVDSQTIFQITDADTNVKANVSRIDDQDFISIISPDHDAVITFSLSDFRRLVASVDRHF